MPSGQRISVNRARHSPSSILTSVGKSISALITFDMEGLLMKKPKVIKSPLKFEEMTNDKLIEEVFGKRLTKN